MSKICIVTGSHLCRNPRVVKEANALVELGHNIQIITIWIDAYLLDLDATLIDLSIKYEGIDLINRNSWLTTVSRLRRRFYIEIQTRLGMESVHSLGLNLGQLYRKARYKQADLYICHQEAGLAVGYRLKKNGYNVAFDFEDWYSKDLLPNAQKNRPLGLLEKLEKYALDHGSFSLTTSNAMAKSLSNYYQTQAPCVIRNLFDASEEFEYNKDDILSNKGKLSLYWFSQTIGPGRGLEEFIQAMSLAHEVKINLYLRGNVTTVYRSYLQHLISDNLEHKLFFLPIVTPQELDKENRNYDVGLALEHRVPSNRNYTITNKIMQYLTAGIPVIATDTEGQIEVATKALNAVKIIDINAPQSIADAIKYFNIKENYIMAKKNAVEAFNDEFNWRLEKIKLQNIVKKHIDV
jgi:glycosyltransferase involved in cell wall biosynthesis